MPPIPLDYESLRIIWWMLLGLLLIGFAIMDGFDLGIGILLHRIAKIDAEKRVVLNTIGPVWEGNQIWLILGAGAIFAAWPSLYAMTFSGFYFAMLMVLISLILRPVGFKYRSKLDSPMWRASWDIGIFIAAFVPTFVFGVAVGNVLQGVPFYFDAFLRSFYTGTFFQLLNPFAVLCGILSVSMLTMHGGIFLCIKTEGDIQKRAIFYARLTACISTLVFAVGGIWISQWMDGYLLASDIAHNGPSNPLYKQLVVRKIGGWLVNYKQYPWFAIAPLLGLSMPLASNLLVKFQFYKLAWLGSAISLFGIISTVGLSMFPVILPSSSHPEMSLLVWDASSSQTTLFIMLIATLIFLPIIIVYTGWVYYILRGKVTGDYLEKNKAELY